MRGIVAACPLAEHDPAVREELQDLESMAMSFDEQQLSLSDIK